MTRRPPRSTLFPYPTLSRSAPHVALDPKPPAQAHPVDQREVGHLEERPALPEEGGARLDEHRLDRHPRRLGHERDRKSTRLNSSHANISYAVFCLKKKKYGH